MTYNIVTPLLGAQAIADVSTTQKHPLGMEVDAYDGTYGMGTFKYMKGVASTVVGSWVSFTQAGVTTLSAANVAAPLAVAMSICSTTTKFGWYQVKGTAVALGLTSITATSGFLYLASAGALDDASVIGDAVFNAKKTATVHVVGTFLDTFSINRPFATNRVSVSN